MRVVLSSAAAFLAGLIAACVPHQEPVAPIETFAMQTAAGVPFIQLRIGESQPLNFMIDTGFDVNVIDLQVAQSLGLYGEGAQTEAQPGGAVTIAELPPIDLTGAQRVYEAIPFTGFAIGESLSAVMGRPVAGILGHDFLRRYVVELDYDGEALRLFEPEAWEYDGGAIVPVTIVDDEPLVEGVLTLPSGRTVRAPFKFDTGSLDVAGLALNFVREENIVEPGMPELSISGLAVGGETEGRLIRVRRFQLGSIAIEQPQLGYNVDSGGFENRTNAGTVGAGLFARGRVILDYPHNRIVLDSAYSGRATEEYPSGLLLASSPDDFSEVTVMLVMPNGPGAEAGLIEGDAIVALDGERVDLAQARELLRRTTTRALTIRRGGREIAMEITPRPLLPLLE